MHTKLDRRAPVIAGALLFVMAIAAGAAPEPRLTVTDEQGELVLETTSLTVRYRHSVERTIVEEDLTASTSGVRLQEMRFESFGAGLPSQPEWGGTLVTLPDGRLAIRGMTAVLPSIELRVGEVSEQELVVGDRAIGLLGVAEAGDVLTIRAETRARALWWLP